MAAVDLVGSYESVDDQEDANGYNRTTLKLSADGSCTWFNVDSFGVGPQSEQTGVTKKGTWSQVSILLRRSLSSAPRSRGCRTGTPFE